MKKQLEWKTYKQSITVSMPGNKDAAVGSVAWRAYWMCVREWRYHFEDRKERSLKAMWSVCSDKPLYHHGNKV